MIPILSFYYFIDIFRVFFDVLKMFSLFSQHIFIVNSSNYKKYAIDNQKQTHMLRYLVKYNFKIHF